MEKNVLFLVIDQWRAEALSCLLDTPARTPNLDTLAADAWMSLNHYTVTAPCGPSRASLLTGLYAQNHRSVRNGTPLDENINNIARMARKVGFDPILFGYTDTSADPRNKDENDPVLKTYEGVMPGFTLGTSLNESDLSAWTDKLRSKGYEIPDDPFDLYRSTDRFANGYHKRPAVFNTEDSDTAFMVDEVIDYLKEGRADNWFVHLSILHPHPPWIAPEPYNTLISNDEIPEPMRHESRVLEGQQHEYIKVWLEEQDSVEYCSPDLNVQKIDEEERRAIASIYYGLLAEVDTAVGRLIDHLKATDEFENTLIVVTADHGEQLGDHWLWGKGGYFDQSYHIPLIIRDPYTEKQYRGKREKNLFTESVDIVPTILEWLGESVPNQISGQSLLPLLHGDRPKKWRDAAFWEFDYRNVQTLFYESRLIITPDQSCLLVVRDHRYKYVYFAALPALLFDMQNDPSELNNLANDPAYTHVLLEYSQKLLTHKMLNQDRTLVNQQLTEDGVCSYIGMRS